MLLGGDVPATVKIMTPRGIELTLDVLDPRIERDADGTPTCASCAIRKDSGDDPDVTNGALVYATVTRAATGVAIDGGEGVGRVTKPGLNQPVGAAAINSTPRQMIAIACEEAAREAAYEGGFEVVISIPEGRKLAEHTFNSHLGIEGGLSVLGTSGIVDPMSEAALVKTIQAEVSVIAQTGATDLLVTLGNYGEKFATDTLGLSLEHAHVTCSNLIGDTLAAAIENGMERVLVVGHLGKLVKVSIGITNTHSHNGDGRIEALLACALAVGAPLDVLRQLALCVTTDAALVVLGEAGLLADVMQEVADRVDARFKHYVHEQIEVGFVCFTDRGPHAGTLFTSNNAEELCKIWRMP